MYRVKLSEFEGPLDLLLFFIKRDELDITDIPISRITKEFLDYLHLMASLDLEVAGEFIVMAATLMQIKVRMLLPRDETAEAEEDPRAELVRRLVEYKRFKEMAERMSGIEDQSRQVRYRRFFSADTRIRLAEEEDEGLQDITLFNLIAAYKRALDNMPRRIIHEVQLLSVSVDEQMSYILDFLRVHGPSSLLAMTAHMTEKIKIVVTVIALLELTKNKVISLSGTDADDDVIVRSVEPFSQSAVSSA